jgi:NAD(P)-dependent dehydrogenase (short-subunit alcohol dehydrogenase family)
MKNHGSDQAEWAGRLPAERSFQAAGRYTGEMMPPPNGRCWAAERARVKSMLEEWGSQYTPKDLGDGRSPALVIKGSLETAKKKAQARLAKGNWPIGHFLDNGQGAFRIKRYLKDVRRGVIPWTYWADEDYDNPEILGSYACYQTSPGISAYAAAKGALAQITRTFALEAIGHGIRVNAVGAGDVVTNLLNTFRDDGREFLAEHGKLAPIKRAAQPEEIAEVVAFLASEKSSFIGGAIVMADGGMSVIIQ